VARYRPLAEAKAIPQQDLDTAISREQVSAAAVEGAEAALKDTILSQRTAIQLAEAAVESAKAAVTQAQLNLTYTVVESPVTGIISKLAVDSGNLVGKSEPTLLATVSSIHPIFVDFSITEADYLRLVKRVPGLGRGQVPRDRAPSLDLILADGSVFPHKGRPIFIDRAIDLKTGTIPVRAEFPNPERILRPGQFGRVRAVTEQVPNAILVPQVAVQDIQGVKSVLVVGEGDKVALRTVTLREPEGAAGDAGQGRAEGRQGRGAGSVAAGGGPAGEAQGRELVAWPSSSSAAPSSPSSSRSCSSCWAPTRSCG
jgi:membrane fusion protein (multidrug efflux system)